MAKDLDDGEFWLPPQFLTDDDLLMDYNTGGVKKVNRESRDVGAFFPFDFPSVFCPSRPCSDLSSPVESVVGSTETESDEEDYIAELTRKMAHSTLQDDLWRADAGFGCDNRKTWAMAGSPQSTLCSVLGGCGCKQGSSRGSPNCPSQVSSPPPAMAARNETAWDLLYAAAGEVAKMRMMEEGSGLYQNNRGGLLRNPSPISPPLEGAKAPNQTSNVGFHSNQPLSYQQLQVSQFQQLKQQQMMKQQSSAAAAAAAAGWGQSKVSGQYHHPEQIHQIGQNKARTMINRPPPNLSLSAWPTLQQSQQQQQQQPQPGSGMRAVFLGNPSSKRECAGTGVFLPRRIGTPTETRKKPACSTVLLPDRVVQALNLNLHDMEAPRPPPPQLQSRYTGNFTPDYDVLPLKYRNNNGNMAGQQQRRNLRSQPVVVMNSNEQLRLPQEWTY